MGNIMSTIINATTTNGVVIQPDNSGSLQLQTNSGTTALTINTSQNVGIGTSAPNAKLQVVQTFGNSFASSLNATAAGTANNQLAGISFSPTFANTGDFGPRRAADIWSGFNAANWGTQYLAFGVGNATNDSGAATTERMRIDSSGNLLFNSGYGSVATAYGCRAWVNFNGTGTVAIRASANVTSITDHGTGDYTVNLTTAMPDINGTVNATSQYSNTRGNAVGNHTIHASANFATTSTIFLQTNYITAYDDCQTVNVAVFR
jgi:hypothetical protein